MNEIHPKLLYKKYNHSNRPWKLKKIDLSLNVNLHWFKTHDNLLVQNLNDQSLKRKFEVQNRIHKKMWVFLKSYLFKVANLKHLLIPKDRIIKRLNPGNFINISLILNVRLIQIKRLNYLKNGENHWSERLKMCRTQ